MTGRFAPSPTGRMHLGNLWAALLNWLAVRSHNGTLLLRIEDIDRTRCRPAYTDQLLADLRLMGLDWDESPAHPRIRQQDRSELYETIIREWQTQGLVYPCVCSRLDLHASSAPHAEDGHVVYDGRCRTSQGRAGRNPGKPPAWRLRVPEAPLAEDSFCDCVQGPQQMNLATEWGDFIVARADGQYAYQLACAVDDALTGVDFVLRGADLLASSFPQRYIMRLLGRPAPHYCHVPLLADPDRVRLSKRQRALDLGEMLASGLTPERITGRLAHLAGLIDRPEAVRPQDLLACFTPARIPAFRELVVDPARWT